MRKAEASKPFRQLTHKGDSKLESLNVENIFIYNVLITTSHYGCFYNAYTQLYIYVHTRI